MSAAVGDYSNRCEHGCPKNRNNRKNPRIGKNCIFGLSLAMDGSIITNGHSFEIDEVLYEYVLRLAALFSVQTEFHHVSV